MRMMRDEDEDDDEDGDDDDDMWLCMIFYDDILLELEVADEPWFQQNLMK